MRRMHIFSVVTLVVALASPAFAEWPNLNPFSSAKKSSAPAKSWLPTWSKPTRTAGPTTWQKVQAAPGKMAKSTKNTLAPLNPFKSEPVKTSGYNPPAKKDTGWWPSWGSEEKKPVNSVSDWLDNPRPE